MEVSRDEDARPKLDVSTDQKKTSAGDDAKDGGVSSAESIAPNLISSGAPGQSDPSAAAQVATTVLPTSRRGCKRPLPTTRHNKPLQQVD
jgi:hypothetical protein